LPLSFPLREKGEKGGKKREETKPRHWNDQEKEKRKERFFLIFVCVLREKDGGEKRRGGRGRKKGSCLLFSVNGENGEGNVFTSGLSYLPVLFESEGEEGGSLSACPDRK